MITPKDSIQKIFPYSDPSVGRMDFLRLDFNENVLGPSPKVLEALGKISRAACGCYPEYENLNRALAQFLNIREECLIPTNGSDEAIRSIFDTYVENGDEVILLSPSTV